MNTSALAPQSYRAQRRAGDAYLKFYINERTPAVIAMKHVQEVLNLPSQRLTTMPNMPACVLGLMSRRSRVMWAVNLAHMMGIEIIDSKMKSCNVMILRVGATPLCVAVHRVEGINWVNPDHIQSPIGQVTARLVPYLRGCLLQENDMLLVLDAEAIVQSPILHNH